MIGFTYIKANIDRYGKKFIGFDNLSKIFSRTAQIILALAAIASLASLVGIGYIFGR